MNGDIYNMSCILPAGAGLDHDVQAASVVDEEAKVFLSESLVSYGAPAILRLESQDCDSDTDTSLRDCLGTARIRWLVCVMSKCSVVFNQTCSKPKGQNIYVCMMHSVLFWLEQPKKDSALCDKEGLCRCVGRAQPEVSCVHALMLLCVI